MEVVFAAAGIVGIFAVWRYFALRLRGLEKRLAEEREERERRDWGALALASLDTGILVLDRRQRVLHANPAAERMWGPPGRPLWESFRSETLDRAIEAREKAELDIVPRPDARYGLTLIPVPPDRFVIEIRDTTRSARYDELRKEFVANVSHELRTPLTFIKGFVETLLNGAMDDRAKARGFLEIIQKHSNQLARLVEDLLDLSKLESSSGLPRRQSVDVRALLAKVVDLERPGAERKRQTIQLQAETVPSLDGDPDYLERAFTNLVDNAIKYTPEGGRIRVAAAAEEGAVRVEVEDTGIGIPEEDLERIFERFYRVDKSRSREMGGTGLGLAIVKHVVQAHGGRIAVRSVLGSGTVFTITIPMARA